MVYKGKGVAKQKTIQGGLRLRTIHFGDGREGQRAKKHHKITNLLRLESRIFVVRQF